MSNCYKIITALIGLISLTICFFLVLVATSNNIRDNMWEYGVLRSIGLSKAEGQRIYMYESFLVIFSAGCLGMIIGLVTSILVTLQFKVFEEQPFRLYFPGVFVAILAGTTIITTFFAVYGPIRDVNNSTIAKTLKSG